MLNLFVAADPDFFSFRFCLRFFKAATNTLHTRKKSQNRDSAKDDSIAVSFNYLQITIFHTLPKHHL